MTEPNDWMIDAAKEIIAFEEEAYREKYDPKHIEIFARIIKRHMDAKTDQILR